MNNFIELLNVTDVSSSDVELESVSAPEHSSGQCDCHCCDGCDGDDTDA